MTKQKYRKAQPTHRTKMMNRFITWTVLIVVALASTAGLAKAAQTIQQQAQASVQPARIAESKSRLLSSGVSLAQAAVSVDPEIARTTINHLLANTESPRAQPEVYRTVVEGDYALASWRWGEAGGQTVLFKPQGEWTVLSAGGGANDVATLEAAGVPSNIAQTLIDRDRATWSQPSREGSNAKSNPG